MSAMTDKWVLIFDTAKCNGCCNCVLATMDEHVDNAFPGYAESMPRHGHKWLDIECHERGAFPVVDVAYLAKMCQHCEDPPCAKPVPGAVRKRPDGIVVIDPELARGARAIVDACPYGAVHWNDEKQIPQHWNFDAHLIDQGWTDTRASQACPTGAIEVKKWSDAHLNAAKRIDGLVELRPELASNPRVLYRNLHRVQSVFLAGTVVEDSHGAIDASPNATVHLIATDGRVVNKTQTDTFGDFRFDGLSRSTLPWSIEVRTPDGRHKAVAATLKSSNHVGEILLS